MVTPSAFTGLRTKNPSRGNQRYSRSKPKSRKTARAVICSVSLLGEGVLLQLLPVLVPVVQDLGHQRVEIRRATCRWTIEQTDRQ